MLIISIVIKILQKISFLDSQNWITMYTRPRFPRERSSDKNDNTFSITTAARIFFGWIERVWPQFGINQTNIIGIVVKKYIIWLKWKNKWKKYDKVNVIFILLNLMDYTPGKCLNSKKMWRMLLINTNLSTTILFRNLKKVIKERFVLNIGGTEHKENGKSKRWLKIR